jgi:hypothetical protein
MRQEKVAELLINIETVEKPQLLPFVEIHNSKINHLQAQNYPSGVFNSLAMLL